jgi:hypothetical protein
VFDRDSFLSKLIHDEVTVARSFKSDCVDIIDRVDVSTLRLDI